MTVHVTDSGDSFYEENGFNFNSEIGCLEIHICKGEPAVLVRTRMAVEFPPQPSYDVLFLQSLLDVEARWPGRSIVPCEWIPWPQLWPLTAAFFIDRDMMDMALSPETRAALVAAGYTAFM